jgi:hypothetical protein
LGLSRTCHDHRGPAGISAEYAAGIDRLHRQAGKQDHLRHLRECWSRNGIAYDVDLLDLRWLYWRAAHFVDKTPKDTRPSDPPVEFPPGFWLAANLGTAKLLGMQLLQPY